MSASPPEPGVSVDFATEVAPLLETRCLNCHNDVDRSGDVSLATATDLIDSGAISIEPGETSRLIELITPTDGSAEMPQDAPPLSPAEIDVLSRWIASGANWPEDVILIEPSISDRDWWSLRPLAAPVIDPTPTIAPNASTHPIDVLVDAKLRENDLRPVGTADPATLVRRLHYDLTGLPPTPAEIQAYLEEDQSAPNIAYTTLVDRLLDSPRFGEKWGQHWLDVARYAETHGYDKDKPRNNAWPYRDYVIRSFNDDKPYWRFVQEQVAGDALFPGDPDGIIGLGFLAAGPWDFIGHTEVGEAKLDGRIAKHLDRDEMVSAVFNVFMSTTVQCAQCHHHKFDPIRSDDYYRLHAVFAGIDRADRVYAGLSPEQKQRQRRLTEQIAGLEKQQGEIQAERDRAIGEHTAAHDRHIEELIQRHGIEPSATYGYHSHIASAPDTTKWVQIDFGEPRSISLIRLTPAFDNYNAIGAGFGFPRRYRIETSNDAQFSDASVRCVFDASGEDQPNPKLEQIVVETTGDSFRYLRVTATKLSPRRNDFIFALGEIEALDSESGENVALHAAVSSLDSIEAEPRWSVKNLTDGIVYRRVEGESAISNLIQWQRERDEILQKLDTSHFESRLTKIAQSLDDLRTQLRQFPVGAKVYAVATHFDAQGKFKPTEGKPRAIHLLHRGDLRSPGERVAAGLPMLWHSKSSEPDLADSETEAESRASLARYLTVRENPLVWRSIANRIWQWVFGKALVSTPNDFGRMGTLPTNPELLDYLATRLRDDPQQSIKAIVRLLVTSRAYRRASFHNEHNAAIDSNNTLLWRYNRRRLTAEEYRDSLLSIGGVLRVDERGGPSFQDFVIEKPQHSPHYEYHLHDPNNPKSHRRSIYRFVVRSQPQPMMTTLDCADPSISVPQRDESTTALQALTQWNHRLTEAMSKHFAARIKTTPGMETADQQIDLACVLTWGRSPDDHERAMLRNLMQTHGEATLARVLLNTSQFIYVE
ncbi:DUF1549 domain-containing protein [Novipirellula maiorica]|uniref:DUF1549 domain-containing protein n=1 Tax=Novipirellula maiorica TaxID=1265734 RepID=UPI001360B4A6|nr:DUF1549 domain-containing protein [Rhodopirellula maiorica]